MADDRRSGRSERRRSRSPNESRHNYHDDREKRSRGDDSRGRHRDRDRGSGRESDRRGESSRGDQRNEKEEMTKTVIIKGLPAHTTEPSIYNVLAPYLPQEIRLIAERDTGDCKGFAFVVFSSIEHAQFFMLAFAGSSGDPNAPQLIIGNRAVILAYARDDKREREPQGSERGGPRRTDRDDRDRDRDSRMKNDWLCDACNAHNFSRRAECFRCTVPRGDNVTFVGPNGTICTPDALTDAAVGCDIPSPFLAVKGFGPFVYEDSIIDLFRQFAVVKSVYLLRDGITGISKGVAFVEFHTVEHAVHTLQQTSLGQIHLDSSPLKILYARESFRQGQIMKYNEAQQQQQMQQQMQMQSSIHNQPPNQLQLQPPNQPQSLSQVPPSVLRMAAEALQSARWSSSAAPINPPQQPRAPTLPSSSGVSYTTPGNLGPKIKPDWPPCFDSNGGAYIFQAQSGNFLEPKSQFFYCPKSKLYYSCSDGVYYNCGLVRGKTTYIRFNPPLPTEPEGTTPTDSDKNSPPLIDPSLTRKPVVLSMGFGMKGKNSSVKIINIAAKKTAGDMMKWGSMQEGDVTESDKIPSLGGAKGKGKPSSVISEIVAPPNITAAQPSTQYTESQPDISPKFVGNNSVNSLSTIDPRISPIFVTTSAAAAVALITGSLPVMPTTELVACLLCRRQFASPEQLLRHERESKLHKDNMILAAKSASDDVAKQLAAFSAATSSASEHSAGDGGMDSGGASEYRDRASERRATYQHSSQSEPHRERDRDRGSGKERGRDRDRDRDRNYESTYSTQKSEVDSRAAPSSSLNDASNPGTQMLRKMGWNEGQGLGREGTGMEESVGVLLASESSNSGGKRITGIGASSSAIPKLKYSASGREYKDSLLRAAKARYDQISKE